MKHDSGLSELHHHIFHAKAGRPWLMGYVMQNVHYFFTNCDSLHRQS